MVPLSLKLKEIKYFQTLTKNKGNFTQSYTAILWSIDFWSRHINFPYGYPISNWEYTPISQFNSYPIDLQKYICHNGFHVETNNDNNNEYQFIIKKLRIYQANDWKNSFDINGIVLHIYQIRRNIAYKIIFRILIYSRHGIITLIILGYGWHKKISAIQLVTT